jgi:hypothetical protein
MYNFPEAGSQYIHKINGANFTDIALALFRHQYMENKVYRSYVDALQTDPASVQSLLQIPFLPISFFKTHTIAAVEATPSLTFESSGTTGEIPSRHHVYREALYEASLLRGFREFYGDPAQYALLALLPSYLERKNASLVHMARVLMRESGHADNGFYLNEWRALADKLKQLEAAGQPTLLLGVTFALLDFAEAFPLSLHHTIVMETGGMKGRKEEWTRAQVHAYLQQRWGLAHIHSEYGMTELLSQAYATSAGRFKPSPTMKVLVRDLNDPLETSPAGNGCLNIVDLANVDSCAFIATEDIGTVYEDGSFEVMGRMDHAALRGCSLMVL